MDMATSYGSHMTTIAHKNKKYKAYKRKPINVNKEQVRGWDHGTEKGIAHIESIGWTMIKHL